MTDPASDPSTIVELGRIRRERELMKAANLASGGGGPHGPDMEPRVAVLEADMKEVKASLKGLERSSDRIEAVLATLVTKSDVAVVAGNVSALSERVSAQGARLGAVEVAVKDTNATALSKTLGVGGGITLFGGLVAIVTAAIVLLHYLHAI